MQIPLIDLRDCYNEVKNEIDRKLIEIISTSRFIGGSDLDEFEREFAHFTENKYCTGCSSGTDALIIALKCLDIGPGDIVLTVPNTFIATAEAINYVGADVDFIDVEEKYFTLDPDQLCRYLDTEKGEKVKAVIPVHLYGQMADMISIKRIVDEFKIKMIEDSSQSHGASFLRYKPGYFGEVATYSFYPGKNLGAFGDAGALTTNDSDVYIKSKMLSDHGRHEEKYFHKIIGFNSRLDNLQAAVLRIKLKYLEKWNEKRITIANKYNKLLRDNKRVIIPHIREFTKHVFHLYVVRIQNRDLVVEYLKSKGISTGIHYPVPLHLQPAYRYLNYIEGTFPVAEKLAKEILSLPLWPQMNEEKVHYIADVLKNLPPL